jgi:hypothetical protein
MNKPMIWAVPGRLPKGGIGPERRILARTAFFGQDTDNQSLALNAVLDLTRSKSGLVALAEKQHPPEER